MKGRTNYLLLAGALALAPIVMARADEPSPGQVPAATQKQLDQEISGTISAIDVPARIIRVSGDTFASKTFKVAADAQIVISGVPKARMDDLKAGEQVDISYHEENGAFLATHITHIEAKPPPVQK